MDEVFLNLFREFGITGGVIIIVVFIVASFVIVQLRSAAHERKVRADMAAEAQHQQDALQTRLLKMLDDSAKQLREDTARHETEYREQLEVMQKRLDEYEAASETERAEKEALKKRVSELAVELHNMKLLHTAERKQNIELMATNADLLKVNDTLTKANREQAEQILDYRSKIDKLNEQVSKLERENQTLNDRIQELAQQVQQLTAGQSVNHNQPVETKQE